MYIVLRLNAHDFAGCNYLHQQGYVLAGGGLFVSLSLNNITQKSIKGFDEIFRIARKLIQGTVKFWE